jgi:taurine dioxygenase
MTVSTYRRITIKPVAGALGAQISGVNLARLDEDTFAEIRRAFAEYLVIYFHDQEITPQDQCAFAARFGPLTHHPLIRTLPDHPHVAALIRDADATGINFGGQWHADATFMESPPLGSTLYAIEVPPYGGDTLFANLYLAYESLSPGMKALCDQLIVIHSAAGAYDPDRGAADPKKSLIAQKGMQFNAIEDPKKETEHPLVCIHPDTGRKLIWETGVYCLRFKDMTEEESKPLLQFLHNHISNPNFTCRFSYRKGTLGMWDNRCVQHFAVNDYPGFRRVMHRVQIGGTPPVGPAMPRRGPWHK